MAFSYHTQHSPLGAFASFACGLPGAPGGFGQSARGPAGQNLYVAHRSTGGDWQTLPLQGPEAANGALAYLGENPSCFETQRVRVLTPEDYVRQLGWASDCWKHADFRFTLFSPWDRSDDPTKVTEVEARLAFAPLVTGEIAYDNTRGSAEVELFFGVNNPEQPWRPLMDAVPGLVGFAAGLGYGFATVPSAEVKPHQSFDPYQVRLHDHRGLHLLGAVAGLHFRVPAGERRAFPLVLGFFRAGPVSTGLSSRFLYTKYFNNLEDVLRHGLAQHEHYVGLAARRDAELAGSALNGDQRWLVAQATHSYLGSSQLLLVDDVNGEKPLWNVNEGEYRMINTFDLTVDHLFFELEWHPWAVRNVLDLYAERYAFTDQIRARDGRVAEGGLAFTHDMGVADQFTLPGYSSYECQGAEGCFSHMCMEQLLNWICSATTYAEHTGDDAWLRSRMAVLLAAADSLRRRDDPDVARRDGIPKWDSARCGEHGAEITTYDSLDVSLGQARNNLYITGKALAAWLLLERAFKRFDRIADSQAARQSADLAANALVARFEPGTGFFPAVFEAGNTSRILPAVEGLVFPLFLGWAEQVRSRYPELFACYARHLSQALQPGVCLDERSGAWKISSTSVNTWFSKIALAQYIVRSLFPSAMSPAARAADRVHADFQRSAACGRFAMVDQVRSTDGGDLGSRYYPRVVTSCLWLRETPRSGDAAPGTTDAGLSVTRN
jgi:xylan 1,4-beta-xylosidase